MVNMLANICLFLHKRKSNFRSPLGKYHIWLHCVQQLVTNFLCHLVLGREHTVDLLDLAEPSHHAVAGNKAMIAKTVKLRAVKPKQSC